MSKSEDYIGQNFENKRWLSTNLLFTTSKYMLMLKGIWKQKFKTTLAQHQVPGPQVFLDASRGIIKMQLVHKILKYNTFCLFNPILMSHDVIYLWIILLIIFLWINLWIIFESFSESFINYFCVSFSWIIFVYPFSESFWVSF